MEIIKDKLYKSSDSGMIIKASEDHFDTIVKFGGTVVDPGKYQYSIGFHSTDWSVISMELYKEEPISTDNYEIY